MSWQGAPDDPVTKTSSSDLFFITHYNTAQHQKMQMWVTDGTDAGTQLVLDAPPAPPSPPPGVRHPRTAARDGAARVRGAHDVHPPTAAFAAVAFSAASCSF